MAQHESHILSLPYMALCPASSTRRREQDNMTGRATHGHTRGRKLSPTFLSWLAMRARCSNPKNSKYQRYGGRGIMVCDRWVHSFENFLADMGERPPGTTLDRKENNGNYEPENCRWATPKQQAENRAKSAFHRNGIKHHCPSGHPYAGKNLRITRAGDRKCKTCERIRAQQRRNANKA